MWSWGNAARDGRALPLSFVRVCFKVVPSNAETKFLGIFNTGQGAVTHQVLGGQGSFLMVISALKGRELRRPVARCLPLSSASWMWARAVAMGRA